MTINKLLAVVDVYRLVAGVPRKVEPSGMSLDKSYRIPASENLEDVLKNNRQKFISIDNKRNRISQYLNVQTSFSQVANRRGKPTSSFITFESKDFGCKHRPMGPSIRKLAFVPTSFLWDIYIPFLGLLFLRCMYVGPFWLHYLLRGAEKPHITAYGI